MANGLESKYFVLKPKGEDDYAAASRAALYAYAAAIRHANPQLASDLEAWAGRERNIYEQIGKSNADK